MSLSIARLEPAVWRLQRACGYTLRRTWEWPKADVPRRRASAQSSQQDQKFRRGCACRSVALRALSGRFARIGLLGSSSGRCRSSSEAWRAPPPRKLRGSSPEAPRRLFHSRLGSPRPDGGQCPEAGLLVSTVGSTRNVTVVNPCRLRYFGTQ